LRKEANKIIAHAKRKSVEEHCEKEETVRSFFQIILENTEQAIRGDQTQKGSC